MSLNIRILMAGVGNVLVNRRRELAIGVAGGLAVGGGLAAFAAQQHGYVASYMLLIAGMIGAALLILAVPLTIFRSSRSLGLPMLIAGPLVFLACYSAMLVMARTGVWRAEMVEFGPDQEAGLVFLFEEDVDPWEPLEFVQTTLGRPHPSGNGFELLDGISNLVAVSVEGRSGYAVRFLPNVDAARKSGLQQELETHPVVWKVYADVAPDEIRLD